MKKNDNKSGAEFLRQQAEERLKKKSVEERGNLSETDSLKLIHELEVHQIELEMQNDELRRARAVAEVASDKYTNLYDFSPTGYLSLSKQGEITELNLYAAQLLGTERSYLKGIRFGIFVSDDTKDTFNQFLEKAFKDNTKEVCELNLLQKGNSAVFVHLTGLAAGNGETCLVSLIDITKRKQAEMELRESEVKFKALFETATDGIVMLTADGEICALNEAFARMHGFTVDEMMDMNISDLDTPEISLLAPSRMQWVMAGESMTFEVEHYHRSGHSFPIEVTANLVTIAGNKYFLGFHREITKRKELEKALNESETQHRSLFEISTQGIVYQNSDGYIVKANPAAQKILGLTLDQMQARTSYDPRWCAIKEDGSDFPGEQHPAMVSLKTQKAIQNTIMGVFNPMDERVHWININAFPMLTKGEDTPDLVYIVFEDFTVRKLAEDNLKEQSARLQLATRAGGVGIWDYNIINNILVWDDQMFKLYGLDKNKFNGVYDAWLTGVHPEDKERCDSEMQNAISGGQEYNTEFRVVWQDGTIHFIRALAVVQKNDSGNPIKMTGTNWDISAQKHAEQSLRENEKTLQDMDVEKDKFFSILAHDLRSPFNSLLWFSQMLVEDLPSLSQAQIQSMTRMMRNSITNVYGLLENLLEWGRMQGGKIPFDPSPLVLLPSISPDMQLAMDMANKKDITLRITIREDLMVFADQYMLSGILRNLTSNAVKFTPKGGKVTLAAKQIPDSWVKISVSDTGIGMSKEIADNLFRLDANTSRKGTENEPSTGLGLILCKEFVEKQGGRLWVESEEGRGSTFYFTLPFSTENKPEEIITDLVSEGQSKKLKILIVEDDEISDSLILTIIEKYGKEIIHAQTGMEAVESCRNNIDLDLVLMDINLPEIDGFEATRQIRQFNKKVIIIAQTAYKQLFEKVIALESGCNDYIVKPIDSKLLLGLIRKHFSTSQ